MSTPPRQLEQIEATHGAAPPPLLRNMSMRPRTPVDWISGGVSEEFVLFEAPEDARTNLRRALSAWGGKRELVRRLDEAWAGFGLVGAALLYRADGASQRAGRFRLVAQDRDLTLNVLCRARSGLLLPEFPLSVNYTYVRQSLWSDDARLVRLALRTGAEELHS